MSDNNSSQNPNNRSNQHISLPSNSEEHTNAGHSEPRMWLSDLSINQPVLITMFVLAVLVIGVISYTRMGLDLLPNFSMPIVGIQTTYPGANPEEVERSITKVIEDSVISLNGVDSVTSTSTNSSSLVIVQFNMDADDRAVLDDVRMRIDMIKNSFPGDASDPMVVRYDPTMMPILSVAVSDKTGKISQQDLRALADDNLKPRIEQIEGVAGVTVVGGTVKQIHVDLNSDALQSQAIAPSQVTSAIQLESMDMPAGSIPNGKRDDAIRTIGKVSSLTQLGEIPITTKSNGVPVKIKDIATISEGHADITTMSRLNGTDSIVIQIQKQSGSNSVKVADEAKRELTNLEKAYPDLSFVVAMDQSTFTRESVSDVQFTLLLGAILAAIVVLLFFHDFRNTLVTVAGLPMVVAGTFAVMQLVGITFNMISLMALSLSIGMLIDDAIVVRENIFRHMENGEDPKTASRRGTAEIALAVLAVTSTIVAVFLPIGFTGGITGKFLRDFGLTVAIAVIVSLVEAFTLAPMLSAYFFKRIDPAAKRKQQAGKFETGYQKLNEGYRVTLDWSLRHRAMVIIAGIVVFAVSVGVIMPRLTMSFIPDTDQGVFSVSITMPPGTRLVETDRTTQALEQVLRTAPEVQNVFTTVGSTNGSTETASISVRLYQRGHTNDVMANLRPALEQAAGGATLTTSRATTFSMGSGSTQPIQFAVRGDDLKVLNEISKNLITSFKQIPGAIDVDSSNQQGKPERSVVVNRALATDLGVSPTQLGATLRTLLTGTRASTYRAGEKDLDIIVRLAEADRSNPDNLLNLPLMTTKGTQISLSRVASVIDSTAPTQISRENRQRQIMVGMNYLGRDQGAVLADARKIVESTKLPDGVSIEVTGTTKYQDEMTGSFGFTLGLAILFIYMILASQFGSFVHPFTIMLAVPFSIVGALIALFIFRFNFDMMAMIGLILLMGLVTKNSILLVDFINKLRQKGTPIHEAILEAGPIRLRPILMTTLAMIFGMVPVALGIGAGAEMRQAMAISVIGGLIVSTILTLVFVPVAYSVLDSLVRKIMPRQAAPVTVAIGTAESTSETIQEEVK